MTINLIRDIGETAGRVLVVAASSGTGEKLAAEVSRCGFDVRVTDSLAQAWDELSGEAIDVCVIDDADGHGFAPDVALQLHDARLSTQLVCLVSAGSLSGRGLAPAARCRLLEKPYSSLNLHSALSSAARQSRLLAENQRLKRQLLHRTLREMVGSSAAMQTLRAQVQSVADKEGSVLIRGEPGTGTHLVAHGIHTSSRSTFRPFIRFDCRLLATDYLERELFGPGRLNSGPADLGSPGQPAWTEAGTLFLDHVDAIALPLQKRLVRIVEARCLQDPERSQKRPLGVRLLAATHADLPEQIRRGLFRDDLFRRLREIEIVTPTLRDRRDDISLLTEHFLNRLVVREGKPARRVSLDALRLLEDYDWPGNVRELQNVIERACSLDFGPRLTTEMIRPWLAGNATDDAAEMPGMALKEMERKLIETTFTRCGGNRERTAQTLQIGLRTLSGKLREYGYPPRGGPGSNLKISPPKAA